MAERRQATPGEIANADQNMRRITLAVDAMIANAPPLTGDRVTDQMLLVAKALLPAAGTIVSHEDELDMAVLSIAADLLHRMLR